MGNIDEHLESLVSHVRGAALDVFGKAVEKPRAHWMTGRTLDIAKARSPARRLWNSSMVCLRRATMFVAFTALKCNVMVKFVPGAVPPSCGYGAIDLIKSAATLRKKTAVWVAVCHRAVVKLAWCVQQAIV